MGAISRHRVQTGRGHEHGAEAWVGRVVLLCQMDARVSRGVCGAQGSGGEEKKRS